MDKKPLSPILDEIQPSITMGVTSKAQALREQGFTVYSLGAGEPDFFIDDKVKMAAVEAIVKNLSKYGPVEGLWELREAIAKKLEAENGIYSSPDEIIVSSGAKHSLFTAMQALLGPGEEILIPVPAWVSYIEMARIAGASPKLIYTEAQNSFKATADSIRSAITEKTKVIIINSPSNPTGSVYSKRELEEILSVCEEFGIYVISDEIYEKFLYTGATHTSMASLSPYAKESVITINGFSKTYAMPGWRVGYAMAPKKIVEAMSTIQGHCVSHPSNVSQYAAIAALSLGEDYIDRILSEYSERRMIVKEFLDNRNLSYPEAYGAFYCFFDIKQYLSDDLPTAAKWCEKLLEQEKVACIPGEFFGANGYVRVSYAVTRQTLEEALKRIGAFMDSNGVANG